MTATVSLWKGWGIMRGRKLFYAAFAVISTGILSLAPMTAFADESRWDYSTSRDANNDICIDFEEIQVTLPASWSGNVQMGTNTDSVSFYQTKSRQLWTDELGFPNGGWLFSIEFSDSYDFLDNPSYMTIGESVSGIYYATFPTDMQGYSEDSEAYAEYQSMAEDVEWIKQNITITNPADTLISVDGDYIFPQSSSAYLRESDLDGLDDDEVQMAINEIYARHHRKFVIQSIQDYFNSKSWYDGYIEADDFDVSVMNTYEGANIALMVQHLNSSVATDQNVTILTDTTKDAYGMIIESGSGYFRVRIEDGSAIQFWYDSAKLSNMGLTTDSLKVGATVSLIYDSDSYEALSILVW
jgi:hypothetical protein